MAVPVAVAVVVVVTVAVAAVAVYVKVTGPHVAGVAFALFTQTTNVPAVGLTPVVAVTEVPAAFGVTGSPRCR